MDGSSVDCAGVSGSTPVIQRCSFFIICNISGFIPRARISHFMD